MKYFITMILTFCLVGFAASQDTKSKTDKKQTVPELESEVATSGYVYKPAGRRDPFWDSLRGTKQGDKEKIAGIAGLTINELTLEGILMIGGAYKAQFRGPDNRPY